MKKLLLIFLLSLLGELSASAATTFVRMTRFNTFDPKDISINVGDTVTWTNTASIFHDAVAFDETFRSPLFGIRQTYSFTFTRPGQFDYYCTPHLGIGMVGSVTVVGAANTAPTATITVPANNATFDSGQPIEVTVNATDDSAVTKVDLLVDGAVTQTDTLAPYQFTLNLSTGPHTLVARATDQPGLTGDSSTVNVTVRGPNQPPTISILEIADGNIFVSPADLTIKPNVQDDQGVVRVEFFVDGSLEVTDNEEPFQFTRTFTTGTYQVIATAYDAQGLSASAQTTLFVRDPLPEVPRIALTSPTPNSYVPFTNVTALQAGASDNESITDVEFFDRDISLGSPQDRIILPRPGGDPEGFDAIYTLRTSLREGEHTITVRVIDNDGNSATSIPVTFTVALQPTFTSSERLTNGVTRLSVFGTSGVPFVFEHSEDMTTWTPFLTNALVRRILFFDDLTAEGGANRIYRARSPVAP